MLEAAKGLINTIRPVPKHSLFREKGQLNFQEFQVAGDGLTRSCLTWQWVSAPDAKKVNKNLDPNKQYLRTQKVRCTRRVKDIPGEASEKELQGGWLAPNPEFEGGKKEKQSKIVDLEKESSSEQLAAKCAAQEKKQQKQKAVVLDSDDEDEDTGVQEQQQEKKQQNLISVNDNYFQNLMEESKQNPNERKYDIYITYYEYERVPRMWFQGYKGEDMVPLTYKEMLEDVMTDYAEKTVTYENHPFLGRKMPSIHPCKHAIVMKKFIDQIQSNGGQIRVQNAMSVFLKFISSVVPTIESDFTSDLDFGGDMAK